MFRPPSHRVCGLLSEQWQAFRKCELSYSFESLSNRLGCKMRKPLRTLERCNPPSFNPGKVFWLPGRISDICILTSAQKLCKLLVCLSSLYSPTSYIMSSFCLQITESEQWCESSLGLSRSDFKCWGWFRCWDYHPDCMPLPGYKMATPSSWRSPSKMNSRCQ